MALRYPRFMWGWSVGPSNNKLVFKDADGAGGGQFTATLFAGDYLPTEFADEVQRAMREANTHNQLNTCAFDFATRTFELGGTSLFQLLFLAQPNSCNTLLGFDATDQTGATTYTGSAVGISPSTMNAWVPAEPVAEESPVRAQGDGTAAKLLQRSSKVLQNRSDGGLYENIWLSTDKLIRLRFRWLSDTGAPNSEQDKMESLLDWVERGRRVNYQPDKDAEPALRLMLLNPGESQNAFSWPGRPETDYPELVFVEQLSRT